MTSSPRQVIVTGQIYGNITRAHGGEALVHVRLGTGNERQIRCVVRGLSPGLIQDLRAQKFGRCPTITATGRITTRYGKNSDGLIEPEIVCLSSDDLLVVEPPPHEGPRAFVRGSVQLHAKAPITSFNKDTCQATMTSGTADQPFHLQLDLEHWVTTRLKESGRVFIEKALSESNREISIAMSPSTTLSGTPGNPVVIEGIVDWFLLQA